MEGNFFMGFIAFFFFFFKRAGSLPLHSFASVVFHYWTFNTATTPLPTHIHAFLFLLIDFISPATPHCVTMCIKWNIYFCSATCPESSMASCLTAVATNSLQLQSVFPASATFLFHMLTPFQLNFPITQQ